MLIEQTLWKTKKTADSSYFWWCFLPHLHFSAHLMLLWQVDVCWECPTTTTKQHGQGLGVPQHLNWGASPSCPELSAQPTDTSELPSTHLPGSTKPPWQSCLCLYFIRWTPSSPTLSSWTRPREPFPPCTWQQSPGSVLLASHTQPKMWKKTETRFFTVKEPAIRWWKMPSGLIFPVGGGHRQGRVVGLFLSRESLSWAQAASGSTWRFEPATRL